MTDRYHGKGWTPVGPSLDELAHKTEPSTTAATTPGSTTPATPITNIRRTRFGVPVMPSLDQRADAALDRLSRAIEYYLTFGGDDAKNAAIHAQHTYTDYQLQLHFRDCAYNDAHDSLELSS